MPIHKKGDQGAVFFEGEGDEYYRRNYNVDYTSVDLPLKMIPEPPMRVLDVGCSRAFRLAEIRKRYECTCIGIDPAEEVIRREAQAHPDITFLRCFAHAIPITDPFDLVIVNFVFAWIARGKLLASIAEIDRLSSKYLIIGDFHPPKPLKRPYHYVKDESVFSYKQDYTQILLSTGLYKLVDQRVYDYDEFDKGACSLLKKEETYTMDDRTIEYAIGRRKGRQG